MTAASARVVRRPRMTRRAPGAVLSISIVLLVGIGAVLVVVLRARRVDPLAGLELATATRGDIEDTVTALGKVQPRDYVDVGAQVSGQLKRLAVKPGDVVVEGELLAEIDPQLQSAKVEIDRAQLAQLEAEREAQELQVEFAEAQLERQTQLRAEGATREDTFEQTRRDVKAGGAKVEAIKAQIRQIGATTRADEAQLGYTRIYAPMAGTVMWVDARPGQTLIASQQAPVLLRIADLTSMIVWTQVSEADVGRLVPGMALYFTTLGQPGRRWPGELRQLLPAPPKSAAGTGFGAPAGVGASAHGVVLYTALFDVDNAAGELKPEMSAQVFFVVAQAKEGVIVPITALKGGGGTSRDHALREEPTLRVVSASGKLETRAVTVGVRNRFDAQILRGLAPGERVVKGSADANAGEGS